MSMTKGVGPRDDQQHALLATVERIRREQFPHLDPALVREILRIHADSAAGDAEMSRAVEQTVEQQLTKES